MLRRLLPALIALLLAPSAAPAFAQDTVHFCYCYAESSDNAAAAFSDVFEWEGSGPAPQNVMNAEFTRLARTEIGPTKWTSCSAGKDEAQMVRFRSDAINSQRAQGKAIHDLDYSH
jgi:hypothetical protein